MTGDTPLSRRTSLKLVGSIVSTTLLAGCTSNGTADGNGDAGDDDDVDADAWEGVDEIVLEAESNNWIGIEPPAIDSVPNPTLLLVEGREYELTWENGDGFPHNFAVQDIEGGGIMGTEFVSEQGETQTVTFDASADMYEYLCGSHQNLMIGRIEVTSE